MKQMVQTTRRRFVSGAGALLAACGGGQQPALTNTAPAPSAPTGAIEFWQGWSTRTPQLRVYLDQFEKEHPGTKVLDQEVAQLGGRPKMVASMIAGTVPDGLMVFKDMYPLVVPAKLMAGLNKYVARDKVNLQQFGDADVKDRTFGGELVALPSASGVTSGTFLYWNKELFQQAGLNPEQPPRTWTELEQHATRLTQGTDRIGVNPGGRFLSWLYVNGGKLYSDDGKKVAFDSPEARDTLRYLAGLVQKQGGGGELLETTGTNTRSMFYHGRQAMFLEIDLLPSLLRVDAVGQQVNWGIVELPANDKNSRAKYTIPTRGNHGYGVTTGAKNPEGAWALAKFLTLGDAQCGFMVKEQGRVSTLRRCNTDPEVQKKPEFVVFSRVINSVVSVPFNPGDDKVVAALEKHAQQAVLGQTSPDAAIQAAAQEGQFELDEGWKSWRG